EALNTIYKHLPLHAEEGGEASSVNIRDSISKDCPDNVEITSAISLVERLFVGLGLLDDTLLEHGIWRFKSFPASLMAKSLLSSLKDSDQSLFPKGFWGAQSDHSEVVEEQRNVLHYLENQRQRHHNTSAQPVRYVHVAWGLISVDGKFLLRHREDKTRKNRNNYVLIGGRVSQNDLMEANKELDTLAAVSLLQSPEASNQSDAIEVALERELSEETGLNPKEHYSYSSWRTIKPYTAVEGGGANHALTEYRIHVYHINLTQDGLLALSKRIRADENLTWFTADELVKAKSQDGRMAYIDALIEDHDSKDDWRKSIESISPSYVNTLSELPDSFSTTFSLDNSEKISAGKTGKEKDLDCNLTDEEHNLLLSLSLFAKDSEAESCSERIQLLINGWVEIVDDDLNDCARSLTNKLSDAGLPIIEGYKERFYRLALAGSNVYFHKVAFEYRLEDSVDKKTQLIVTRNPIATDLIESESASYTKEISGALKIGLKELMADKDVSGDSQKDLDTFKKNVQRLSSLNQGIGLRALIRSFKSNFQLFDKTEDEETQTKESSR
ncbi:hypothetical protein A3766_10435, partial [Oleiphilus sp. HI0132]